VFPPGGSEAEKKPPEKNEARERKSGGAKDSLDPGGGSEGKGRKWTGGEVPGGRLGGCS